MKYYKVLGKGQRSCHGGRGKWTSGKWRSVRGKLIPCKNGLHLCRKKDLAHWLGEEIWEAEVDGEVVEYDNKVVAKKARITKQLRWTKETAVLFACDCAEHVLPIFEKKFPNDKRPRRAIEITRKYANGEATAEELAAAKDAACAANIAARAAVEAAAKAAAWAAYWAAKAATWAAYWAARAAAEVVTEAAAEVATCAASAAAEAAYYAAETANAEREWQTNRLFEYLVGCSLVHY